MSMCCYVYSSSEIAIESERSRIAHRTERPESGRDLIKKVATLVVGQRSYVCYLQLHGKGLLPSISNVYRFCVVL